MPKMESFDGKRQTTVKEHLREIKSGKTIVVRQHHRNLKGETRYVLGQDNKFHLTDRNDRDWHDGIPQKLLDDSITQITDIMDAKVRRDINNEFTEKFNNKYFENIPTDELFNIIKSNGFVPLMEDNTEWEGWLLGSKGRVEIMLGNKDSSLEKDESTFYNEVENAMFVLSWYKMPSGNYEVVPYIS